MHRQKIYFVNMIIMDLKQLSSFISIAEGNSFSTAAQKNAITRSAVSHQIAQLETEMGAELFVRNKNDVQLTECGQLLLQHARKILKEADDAKDKILGLRGEISGTLRIGVGMFIEPYVRKAAFKMLRDYPEVSMNVKIEQAKNLNAMLRKHELDIAFTMNTSFEYEHIETIPLIPIRICAVVRKTHELAKKSIIEYEEIKRHQIVMPDEDKRSIQTVERFFGKNIDGLKTRIVINNSDAAFATVEEEGFVTFATPAHILNRPNLVSIPIKGMENDIVCNAHWMSDCYLKNSAKVLLDYIRNFSEPYYHSLIDV